MLSGRFPTRLVLYILVTSLFLISLYALLSTRSFNSLSSEEQLQDPTKYLQPVYPPEGELEGEEDIIDNYVPVDVPDVPSRSRPPGRYIADTKTIMEKCNQIKHTTAECLEFLDVSTEKYLFPASPDVPKNNENICSADEPSMLFHIFWRGPFTDKIALTVKSFLYTQPLECSKLVIWLHEWGTAEQLLENEFSKPFLDFPARLIEFKRWNLDTILSLSPDFANVKTQKINTVGYSDMVRFLVLHVYGGIYLDGDVLLLRDMRPLYHTPENFAYKWSYTNVYNTAVFRMRPNSTTSTYLVKQAIKNNMGFHPRYIKQYLNDWEKEHANIRNMNIEQPRILMFPPSIFDPLWLRVDKHETGETINPNLSQFKDVFEVEKISGEFDGYKDFAHTRAFENFFPGAFTYHWHNNWKTPILPHSWFGVMQQEFDNFLNGKSVNYYGEKFVEPY
ncbi:hypothetical protein K7432_006549 [Basidiobolus ranarum]|uniref:Glycosyltransferase n=1 Tax=Basidiobolus ranarum TaxID=34480 RepID=A0ABR2WUU2_9FUNG